MSELPDADFYPETLVKVSEWGEWELSNTGKARRPGVLEDGRQVQVYENGVVLRGNDGRIVATTPNNVVTDSQAASALRAARYEKAREDFVAGLVSGAASLSDRPKEISLSTARRLLAANAFRIAMGKGRDAITAMKYIDQAADLVPVRGRDAAAQEAGGIHLHLDVGDLSALAAALRGAGAAGDIIEGAAREVGEDAAIGGGESEK